ncbi:cation-translocating P-type ATPase [Azotosporobacter soli]|uniref:heavy metal translocating P-type ATPase n=1 Tax=Azotosporobacter soli TaxID=3055040 RepID=UPI0031FE4625
MKDATISTYYVSDLDCADCAAKLESRIVALPGVTQASLNFASSRLVVRHSAAKATIESAIVQAGYKVRQAPPLAEKKKRYLVPFTAAFSFLVAFSLETQPLATLSTMFYAIAILIGGFSIARKAFYNLSNYSIDSNFLMVIAVGGAIFIDQWSEAAAVVVLFSLGHALEHYTLEKTRRAVGNLMALAPERATLLSDDDKQQDVDARQVKPGERILIRPGERIPLDGQVSAGISAVDQSPITGESLPCEKEPGSLVFAGSLNQNGALYVTVSSAYQDSTLASLARLTEEAQSKKAPIQQAIDHFARYYTPCVIIAATLTLLLPWLLFQEPFSLWLYKALLLLVIACPCALVISTPVAVVAALGNASARGILIKGGVFLEAFGNIRSLAFDKTGTLTHGSLSVTQVITDGSLSEKELLSLAARLEAASEHPLARAIRNACPDQTPADDFHALPGLGAVGRIAGEHYQIGSPRLVADLLRGDALEASVAAAMQEGNSVIWLSNESRLLGAILFQDTPRPEAAATLRELKDLLPGSIVLLSGDQPSTASAIGRQLGLSDIRAGLLPAEKVKELRNLQLQHGRVAMIGDGINDAPALAAADIGVAMGTGGSDVALAAADIALAGDDLSQLPYLIRLSRRTMRLIKQNIVFALLLKAIFILAAFSGHATLWMAVFADTGATLLVVANSMRLMKAQ